MIAGLASHRTHDLAARSVRTLSKTAREPDAAWLSDGEPLVWLIGKQSLFCPAHAHAQSPAAPVVTFAGRLHNTAELKSLAGGGAPDPPVTPAALIAALWPVFGPALLDRIVGDFAFALWDPMARELMLATDPMGQWPVHYAMPADRSMLAFASGTQPLRALDWVGSEPDDLAVVAQLLNQPTEPGRTFFANIQSLPSGHRLRWHDGRVDVERYWGPHFARTDIRSVNEMLEAFEHAVRVAVASRLDPARPTALLMSGGYDSTAVAGAVAAQRKRTPDAVPPIVAISAAFGDLPCDESARIDIALAVNGLPSHRVQPMGRSISVESMRRDVAAHDAPFVNFQAPFVDAYSALARDLGATTLMTGLGGDELATDFEYQVDFARAMGVARFPLTVHRIADIEKRAPWNVAIGLARQLCPEAIKQPYRALRRIASPGVAFGPDASWLQPEAQRLARELGAVGPAPPVGFDSYTKEVRWRILANPVVEFARRWFAVETASSGFELESPLLDRRLFELVFATDACFHPRSSDAGEYKPLIARGLSFAPRALVSAYWKVDFDSYNAHVLRVSLATVEAWLFEAAEWKAERYVARESAMRTLRGFRDEPERFQYRAEAIVGLETWLRTI